MADSDSPGSGTLDSEIGPLGFSGLQGHSRVGHSRGEELRARKRVPGEEKT